jgi:hypothetical protein
MIGYQVILIGQQQRATVYSTVKEFCHESGQRFEVCIHTFVVIDRVLIATVDHGEPIDEIFYRIDVLNRWHNKITSI